MDWVVARAQPWSHELATANLSAQGHVCYVPKFVATVARRGRQSSREVFLFGLYFFVQFSDFWRSVTGTRGVAGIIMNGDMPSRLRGSVVEELRSREVNGFVVIDANGLKFHDRVRAVNGALLGQLGIFEGMNGPDRVRVLFTILGNQTRVTMPIGDVEKLTG